MGFRVTLISFGMSKARRVRPFVIYVFIDATWRPVVELRSTIHSLILGCSVSIYSFPLCSRVTLFSVLFVTTRCPDSLPQDSLHNLLVFLPNSWLFQHQNRYVKPFRNAGFFCICVVSHSWTFVVASGRT